MSNIEQLEQIIEKQCLKLPLNRQPRGLFEPIEYIMKDGGKRMRPLLTLLAANIYIQDVTPAVSSALAIEVFHNFTLLHDDIMDNASKRRGRETVHVKWDENTAILSGDAMLILSYHCLCLDINNLKLVELMNELNKVSMEVCQGQQYDMDFESQQSVSIEEYNEMIRLKTAVLMASALKMGAIAAQATKEQQEAIYAFGINLGMAFQIQDDILDTYGNCETFGKAIGGDIAVGKQTYIMIRAKELANQEQLKVLNSSRDFETVKDIYDTLNVKSVAQSAIAEYFDVAMSYLYRCCDSSDESRLRLQPMIEYADTLLKRKK